MNASDAAQHDDNQITRLIEQIAEGSELAFERLWRIVEPHVDAAVRNRRLLQRLADVPAERADCKQTIALKLRSVAPLYLAYRDQQRDGRAPSVMRWIGVVICNTAIDFRRRHPDYQRSESQAELTRRWRTSVKLDAIDEMGRADDTTRGELALAISQARQFRQMLKWASENLPPEQLDGLLRWLYAEDSRQTRAARAALRKLRDHFREATS